MVNPARRIEAGPKCPGDAASVNPSGLKPGAGYHLPESQAGGLIKELEAMLHQVAIFSHQRRHISHRSQSSQVQHPFAQSPPALERLK